MVDSTPQLSHAVKKVASDSNEEILIDTVHKPDPTSS